MAVTPADVLRRHGDRLDDLDRRIATTAAASGSGAAVDDAALAAVLADSSTIDFVHSPGLGTITAEVRAGSITTAQLSQPYATLAAVATVADSVTALDASKSSARIGTGAWLEREHFRFIEGAGINLALVDDTINEIELTVATPAALCIPFHVGTPLVLTDMPSAQTAFGGALERVTVVDLSNASVVKLSALVTVGGSGSSPRVRLRYRAAGYSATIGNYSDIGLSASEVQCSLTGTGFKDNGWSPLDASAIADGVAITLDTIGGNGSADPAVTSVMAYFR